MRDPSLAAAIYHRFKALGLDARIESNDVTDLDEASISRPSQQDFCVRAGGHADRKEAVATIGLLLDELDTEEHHVSVEVTVK